MVKVKLSEIFPNEFITTLKGFILRRNEKVNYEIGSDNEIEQHIKQGFVEIVEEDNKMEEENIVDVVDEEPVETAVEEEMIAEEPVEEPVEEELLVEENVDEKEIPVDEPEEEIKDASDSGINSGN